MNNLLERKKRAKKIVAKLSKLFPEARVALNWKNPWELLVAVVLSAQCTDIMVNKVTEKLFKKYKKLDDYVKAKPVVFEQDIRQTGFYKNKTKSVLAAAKMVKDDFNGKVPNKMEDLLKIPGVARKTANVVLGNAFGIVEGIAVDTHVKRFTQKFELSDSKDPKKIEQDLMELVPKKDWFLTAHRLQYYGREYCVARSHECADHPLTKLYPKAAQIWPKAK